MEIEPISLGRHIDRLVEKNFVERRADPRDRRAWRLYLKPEVQPVLDRLRGMSTVTRKEALQGISPEDAEHFIDLLIKIKSNMTTLYEDDPDASKADGRK